MTMKAKELRERSVEDLRELEKSLATDAFTNRFKNMTNRLDNTSVINETRRDLARVKTLLRQAELNAASTAAPAKAEAKAAAAPKAKKTAAPKASTPESRSEAK